MKVILSVMAGLALFAVATSEQDRALPASGQTADERLAASRRHGEWVTVQAGPGDSVVAWVSYPERQDPAPVVLVIHENTGLTTWNRAVADQLAAEGFIAIAPELLTMRRSGNLTTPMNSDSGRAAIRTLTEPEVQRWLVAVAHHGMALPGAAKRYGVVGFCWGGARSFLHAASVPGLGAAVVYYGSPPSADQLAQIEAPVLGLYGGADARITATVPATDSTLKRLGKKFESMVFEGAGHGFLRAQEAGDGANLQAAMGAWPRTVAFLTRHLDPQPAGNGGTP